MPDEPSELEQALKRASVPRDPDEAEIAADDEGASAMAEEAGGQAEKPEATNPS